MSNWEMCRLGQFIGIKHGFAFKGMHITDIPSRYILVTPGNFHIGGGFKADKPKYYLEIPPPEYILKGDDIIVTMTDLSKESDTLGYSAKVPRDGKIYLHNQRIGLVNFINTEAHPEFIYWLMRTRDYQSYIVGSASGTSIMHTSPNRIKDYKFKCPSITEQKAIAGVLSCLDHKIDLLNRQNKILEAMAETLFRQRFIEEAQDNWDEGILSDEFTLIMGQSPASTSFNEEGIGLPMFQGNADFGFRFPRNRVFTTAPTRIAEKFDTLVSVRAPVGAQNMASEKCCLGRGVAAFRFKADTTYYTYTYYKLMSHMDEIKLFNDEGTVFGSIGKKDFETIETTIPPMEYIKRFENECRPLNDRIINNCCQINKIEAIRDSILPKLMSGEVRVEY